LYLNIIICREKLLLIKKETFYAELQTKGENMLKSKNILGQPRCPYFYLIVWAFSRLCSVRRRLNLVHLF